MLKGFYVMCTACVSDYSLWCVLCIAVVQVPVRRNSKIRSNVLTGIALVQMQLTFAMQLTFTCGRNPVKYLFTPIEYSPRLIHWFLNTLA